MARQKGVLKYVGTLGDVRHFKIKGQEGYFAGMVGGPSGEQVLTAPEFERTRENMNEFGACAKAGKSVRTGLSQLMKQMSDTQVAGRLTAIMKKINLEDQTEARGYRKIEISSQRNYLIGFEFDKNTSLNGIFNAPFTVTHDAGRDSADFVIPAFNPANLVNAPAGSTHFRLINTISVVSDFEYNATTNSYEPMDAPLNEVSDVQFSGFLDLYAAAPATTVTAALPAGTVPTANVTVLQCIGIEFYQQVGPNYYLFATGNCLKVQDAF
ncbi:hypothetical protein FEDK69T_31600 [Flavobacterium enshiense DK69]|uniref:hypothetical protein n=1 Tax=Flavobacterium enshiense TaxID=1341165 RepID=UPI0003C5B2F4|nr:hypothetical protein [Flavobacterium enshiense]ESU19488.1 hypothetical protein FEDK69T_31600 [Flavobacterium enshiense DK69]